MFLLAGGPTPNTNDLGLDRAGVATNRRGYIVVDDQLQTNVPGIWALGDCNGRGAFTHTSYNDYEIVAEIHSTETIDACQTEFRRMPCIQIHRSADAA